MLFREIKIGEEDYKLRLGIKETIELEKKLGYNPLNELVKMGDNGKDNIQLPSFEFMGNVFHYSLIKYQSKIKLDKSYELMELYMEENGIEGLMELIVGIFQDSGFFKTGEIVKE